jgi:aspartate/methionine/tyrosine aminotransferase
MKNLNSTLDSFHESVFSTMSKRSQEHQAINLSQGFPDFRGPDFLLKLAQEEMADSKIDKNQYAPSRGVPLLRQVLAKRYLADYGLNYCANSEVVVTNGATEAIFSTMLALLEPGDEVILFEPYYDSYLAAIQLAGGVPILARLEAPQFLWDVQKLNQLISPKTKAMIVNSPHNPTGRVMSLSERDDLAQFALSHDLYIVSDEVYERLIFDDKIHHPIAAYPGLKERTVTISSAGKTFGMTGWKIGWTMASAQVSHAIHMVHQFNSFSVVTPLQWALARALDNPQDYFSSFRAHYQQLRDHFVQSMSQLGFAIHNPEGSYFSLAKIPVKFSTDTEYCSYLIEKVGVSAIPCSAFYQNSGQVNQWVRFCFAKEKATLDQALLRLAKSER